MDKKFQEASQKILENNQRQIKLLTGELLKLFSRINSLQLRSSDLLPIFGEINKFLFIHKRKLSKITSPNEKLNVASGNEEDFLKQFQILRIKLLLKMEMKKFPLLKEKAKVFPRLKRKIQRNK